MATEIPHVHIGEAIDARRCELKMTKSEFARRIGLCQQHVNNITRKDSVQTNLLIKISEALDYNFFDLYCSPDILSDLPKDIKEPFRAMQLDMEREKRMKEKAVNEEQIENLKQMVSILEQRLKDKDTIIKLLEQAAKQKRKQADQASDTNAPQD